MNKRYEALLALDTQGKEESVKDIVERLEKLFKAEGAKIEQVQRLEKRDLSYEHNHQKSAYFVSGITDTLSKKLVRKVRNRYNQDVWPWDRAGFDRSS